MIKHLKNDIMYASVFIITTLVYILGLFSEIIGVDATQYASISLEMMQSGEYLEVQHRGIDYLDKPPLHFWLSALSFKLFGVSNFAYKLPSFLVTILGVYSTYKIGKLLYNEQVGKWAALMLYTCQALFLINQDVRTDTILVGFVAFSCWQLFAYLDQPKWKYLIGGFVGVGLAMLAKGPLGLMIPGLAIATHIVLNRQWKKVLRWQWLVGLFITGAVLSPMVYGLYHQWDLHPEKQLYGQDHISGVKFYFWDQSFGRITGDNPFINNEQPQQGDDPTFFIHTSFWAFLPWFILAFAGLLGRIKLLWQKRFKFNQKEAYTLGGIILPIVAFSFSQYKLPHYIFVTYPFMAVLGALFLVEKMQKKRLWNSIHFFLGGILLLGSTLIVSVVFPTSNPFVWGIMIIAIGLVIWTFLKQFDSKNAVLLFGCIGILTANLILNTVYYPKMSTYEAGIQVAGYLKKEQIEPQEVLMFHTNSHALEFKYGHILDYAGDVPALQRTLQEKPNKTYVYTNAEGKKLLIASGADFVVEQQFKSYPTTLITLEFLDASQRERNIKKAYLIREVGF